MSDQFDKETIIGSAVSAFIIGAGGALTVGLAAGKGTLNTLAIGLIIATGLVAAAKDYRSLKKLPPLRNGNGGDTQHIKKP